MKVKTLATLSIAVALAGCNTTTGVLTVAPQHSVTVATNTVTTTNVWTQTNVVLFTNTMGSVITNQVFETNVVTETVQIPVTNVVNWTNYTVSSAANNVLAVATGVNTLSGADEPTVTNVTKVFAWEYSNGYATNGLNFSITANTNLSLSGNWLLTNVPFGSFYSYASNQWWFQVPVTFSVTNNTSLFFFCASTIIN